jgi:hypothetical protein
VEKEFITGYHTGPLKNLYKYNDELYAYPAYQSVPIVYRLSENDAVPVYHLQFDKYNLLPIDYLEEISAGNVNFLAKLNQSNYIYIVSARKLLYHQKIAYLRHCERSEAIQKFWIASLRSQ